MMIIDYSTLLAPLLNLTVISYMMTCCHIVIDTICKIKNSLLMFTWNDSSSHLDIIELLIDTLSNICGLEFYNISWTVVS